MEYKQEVLPSKNLNTRKVFTIIIDDTDTIGIKYSNWDLRLFEECEKSNQIADKLLALETIVRKVEQNNLSKLKQ